MPAKTRSLTPAQRMMVEDGLPIGLILTSKERAASWERTPPTAAPFVPQDDRNAEYRRRRQQERSERRRERGVARKENSKPHKDMYFCEQRRCMIYGFPSKVPSAPPKGISVSSGNVRATTARAESRKCKEKPADELAQRIHDCVRGEPSRLQKLAEVNGVWDDRYASITPAQARMTVGNRLRAKWKRGEELKWLQ